MTVILVTSGYFNPLHTGHLDYLGAAKEIGAINGRHIVIVNNDKQVKIKGSVLFMDERSRCRIVAALECVDRVALSVDTSKSVCETLKQIREDHPSDVILFCKGGDRDITNIPEALLCKKLGIMIVNGVGGEKTTSSSELIKRSREKS